MGRLDGKVAFITGAGHGQGRSHAIRLAHEGANLVLCDINAPIEPIDYAMSTPDELLETVALAEAEGAKVVHATADVRKFEEVKAVVDRGLEAFGGIDIVLANAGVISYFWSWEIPEDDFDTIIDVNLKGVWNTARAVIPSMIERDKGGSILFTSSAAGIRGLTHMAHYAAAKHGIVGMMKTMANELAQYNIRVNTIHPTGVATGMSSYAKGLELIVEYPDLFGQGARNILPDAFILEPDEVSSAVLFLVSEDAARITGVQLPVDAGNTVKP